MINKQSSHAAEIWSVDFYADEDGTLPVRDWLDTLPEEVRGKMLARLEMLKSGGPTLDYPYTSQIEGKLREARLRVGKVRYRVLYFFDEARTAILLHGFTKTTAAVEESDKKIGRDRMARHNTRTSTSGSIKSAVTQTRKQKRRR
jgi:phage-related protein